MMKPLFIAAALTVSNAALACGGQSCGHCDKPAETATVDVSKADGTKVALDVKGMSCGACSKKVTAALEAIEGVNAVAVDHETGRADVAFDDKKTNTDAFIAAITALDFKASLPEKKEG